MGAELGGPVLMALFYLPLLCVICADGACSDCAFATRVLLIAPLLIVDSGAFIVGAFIHGACADPPLFFRVIATFGARPGPQVRYTLAMRYYQAHLTIW